jgi:hypothetical protein
VEYGAFHAAADATQIPGVASATADTNRLNAGHDSPLLFVIR